MMMIRKNQMGLNTDITTVAKQRCGGLKSKEDKNQKLKQAG